MGMGSYEIKEVNHMLPGVFFSYRTSKIMEQYLSGNVLQ